MSKHYWLECVASAMEDAGVVATSAQIEEVADCVAGAHENFSMAYPTPENPYRAELKTAQLELKKEREKVHCWECGGSGRLTAQGPYHSSNTQCHKCMGEGRRTL